MLLLQWYFRKQSHFRQLSPHFPTICKKIPFLAIFGHFSPFVPAHGQPLDPTSVFIDKNVITRCCCNEIFKAKATTGYYHLILPPFPWKFNFWPFLAIFHHLCLMVGNPLTPSPFLLTKMLPLGAVAMKSMKRKLLQAITTPFSHRSPDISILGHFWPFLAIFHHLCLFVGHPLTPSPLLLTKMLSVGAVAMISTKRDSYFRLLSPQFPTNDLTCEIAIDA